MFVRFCFIPESLIIFIKYFKSMVSVNSDKISIRIFCQISMTSPISIIREPFI